jgi:hypothetical protein
MSKAKTNVSILNNLATAGGAALIGNAPAGNIAAETVQDAINELDTEKTAAADLAASGGSALMGFLQAGTGAVARTIESKAREIVSVTDFAADGVSGARVDPTGVLDSVLGINAAITALSAAGGGTAFATTGTFLVGTIGASTAVAKASNVTLQGAGRGATIIKLAAGADSHVIAATSVENAGIKSLTVDGSRATQTAAVHGIRLASVDGCVIDDVEVKECYHYGIGGQDGTLTRIKLSNLDIHDTGGDGIDFKNKNDDNADIDLSNISVRRWGLNAAQTIQAGIDIRGPAKLVNIDVSEPGADDCYGVRFRQGELLDANGFGGHRSSITGFDIRMGSKPSAVGLSVVARDVKASNGYISGGNRGAVVQDSGFRGTAITVEGVADDGFLLDALGGGLDADKAVLTGCTAFDCGDRGFSVEADNCQLIGCYSYDNDDGIVVDASAANTKIIGGHVSGNATSQIGNAGTGTVIRDVDGYVTENFVESASLALDSTGSKVATIAHGLAAAPDPKKCTIVHIRETAVFDHIIGFYQVEGIDATNITVRARVTTASGTAGATFKLGVHVRV